MAPSRPQTPARPDPRPSWGGSVNGWAPPPPPPPPRDKDMTQISNPELCFVLFLAQVASDCLDFYLYGTAARGRQCRRNNPSSRIGDTQPGEPSDLWGATLEHL